MKKTILLTITFLLFNLHLFAQDPFNVATQDNASGVKIRQYDNNAKLYTLNTITPSQARNINGNFEVLNSASIGATVNSVTVPNLNVGLIQYRFSLYTSTSGTKYYLPVLVFSKVSTDYKSSSSSVDATGNEGGPLTIRITPKKEFQVGKSNILSVGAISDFRTIVYKDTTTRNASYGFGYYGSLGASYMGDGEVRDETGQTYQGKYVLSILASGFFGSENVTKNIFKNINQPTFCFEGIFKFNVLDRAYGRYDIFISAQYLTNAPIDGNPFIFKIGLKN